jgi:quinol monooxygenase YgiN
MYGSVFRLRPKPGQDQAMIALMERWGRERRPKVEGFVSAEVYRSEAHPGEYLNTVVFTSREAYMKNADDPEQDAWYRELRALLESDPEWEDGEVVVSM